VARLHLRNELKVTQFVMNGTTSVNLGDDASILGTLTILGSSVFRSTAA
jgi:hypothetical protein